MLDYTIRHANVSCRCSSSLLARSPGTAASVRFSQTTPKIAFPSRLSPCSSSRITRPSPDCRAHPHSNWAHQFSVAKMDIDDAPGPSTPPRDNFVYIPEPVLPTSPQPVFPYKTLDTASDPSICIDNGSSTALWIGVRLMPGSHSWRAGYSNMAEPYIDRANMVARYRDKKFGRQVLLFGKDVETDSGAKGNIRQMFDGDLLVQQDILVSLRMPCLSSGHRAWPVTRHPAQSLHM